MINIADNMGYNGKKPLDNRTQYATLALMKAVADANINEGCIAYCVEDDKYYKFKSTNSVDTTTGKWREYQSGGGGTSDYTDLTNKPSIENVTLSGNKSASDLGLVKSSALASVATSGSYNDLSNKPDIPSKTSDLTNDSDFVSSIELSTVARSGSYTDLENKPTIPSDLDDLSDVALSSPTNGQVLKYNSTTQKFENANESGGGGGGHTIEDSEGTDLTQRDTLQFGEGFVAEDDDTNEKTVISPDKMQSGDMDDVITPLPSVRPSRSTILKQVLTAGETTITFNDIPTTGDYIVNFYNSLGISYSAISPSSGSVSLTFPVQSVALDVYCEIREV